MCSCGGFGYLSDVTRQHLMDGAIGAHHHDPPSGPDTTRSRFFMGMGGGGMGGSVLPVLLTELSGLNKPRGHQPARPEAFGLKAKPPPKYRMLIMMATNMPQSLDQALLRPGRIDRIYRVGYPTNQGRVRTYEGYLAKVKHDLTPEQVDRLSHMTPYATGASIKDLVNEALINAIQDDRDAISLDRRARREAPQEPRAHTRPGTHRRRSSWRRGARGLSRGGCVPRPEAPRDRHGHHPPRHRLSRTRRVGPDRGPPEALQDGVRVGHHGVSRVARRRTHLLRGRQRVRRVGRPRAGHGDRDPHGGFLGHGFHHRVARDHPACRRPWRRPHTEAGRPQQGVPQREHGPASGGQPQPPTPPHAHPHRTRARHDPPGCARARGTEDARRRRRRRSDRAADGHGRRRQRLPDPEFAGEIDRYHERMLLAHQEGMSRVEFEPPERQTLPGGGRTSSRERERGERTRT